MIITKEMLNQKVPIDSFPTRLDSAINLYAYIEGKGLVLYNVNPTTWNLLYPFYELNHKFTLEEYQFSKNDITYKELLEEYQKQYHEIYETKLGYDKNKRKSILLNEYKETFHLESVSIGEELESFFELKYSKTKNVWTLYYFENYIVNKVESLDTLLNQNTYPQEFLPLDTNIQSVNGIKVVENIMYLLQSGENVRKLKNNLLEKEE